MLIDSHAHVNFNAYKNDSDEVIKRCLENGVWMINVGSEYKTSQRAVEFANKYSEGVYAAIGLHPIHLSYQEIDAVVDNNEKIEFKTATEEFDFEKYKELAQDKKVVAIGETGFDFYREAAPKEIQEKTLLAHIKLAEELDKPIIFHCREANDDLINLLDDWLKQGRKVKGVIHCFSGGLKEAEKYLDMGFYLGFNGIITFSRAYDEVVKNMPIERLIIETDCPYLTPEPFRGKRNEPLYVKYVAQKIADLRNINFDEVAEITVANTKKLFNL